MLWASNASAVVRKRKNPPRVDFGRVMNFELTIQCMSRPYELDKVASLGSLWRVVCLCKACILLVCCCGLLALGRCTKFVQRWRAYMAQSTSD